MMLELSARSEFSDEHVRYEYDFEVSLSEPIVRRLATMTLFSTGPQSVVFQDPAISYWNYQAKIIFRSGFVHQVESTAPAFHLPPVQDLISSINVIIFNTDSNSIVGSVLVSLPISSCPTANGHDAKTIPFLDSHHSLQTRALSTNGQPFQFKYYLKKGVTLEELRCALEYCKLVSPFTLSVPPKPGYEFAAYTNSR